MLDRAMVASVFAVGDVRQGSVKSVAAGAGEGSICIRLVHEYLAAAADPRHEHAPTADRP